MSERVERAGQVALDRVRSNLGDLFVAVNYPGGPRALYNDLAKAETRIDEQSERMSFAIRVLQGLEDDAVRAWLCAAVLEGDGILCDHCSDLSARMLRAARDRARQDLSRERGQLNALLAIVRAGLSARGQLEQQERYDTEILIKRLAASFGIVDFTTREQGA